MRIKESKQFTALAQTIGVKANQLSDQLISELIQRKILEDTPEVYGETIQDSIDRDIVVSEFVGAMKAAGIKTVSRNYDMLMEQVVMGDGDCPECGGETEVTDGDYKCVGGDGYLTPYEYEPLWEEHTCLNCGHKTSNEPDLEGNRD